MTVPAGAVAYDPTSGRPRPRRRRSGTSRTPRRSRPSLAPRRSARRSPRPRRPIANRPATTGARTSGGLSPRRSTTRARRRTTSSDLRSMSSTRASRTAELRSSGFPARPTATALRNTWAQMRWNDTPGSGPHVAAVQPCRLPSRPATSRADQDCRKPGPVRGRSGRHVHGDDHQHAADLDDGRCRLRPVVGRRARPATSPSPTLVSGQPQRERQHPRKRHARLHDARPR